MISIGIDTGGTYTDAVAIDLETGKVLAKGKAQTTKEDLAIGIAEAMSCLPDDMLRAADTLTISTTLATNACVENKGGRAKLVLVGTTDEVLQKVDGAKKFGMTKDSVLCVDSSSSFDGRVVDDPDWETLLDERGEWFADAEALSVAAVFAINNGGVSEKSAKAAFEKRYNVPVVAAHELASDLNVFERGATAMLNARLLPVIREFMDAVESTMVSKGITGRSMVVRSDGSLISHPLAQKRPVETILSGPAASVLGGHMLADAENSLIIDMGGTTTDISIVKNGVPKMASDGIRIGNWKTQVKGVYVDTFALGGDSVVRLEKDELTLHNRRVLPYCAAAVRWPEIIRGLETVLSAKKTCYRDFLEFLFIVKTPDDYSRYSSFELNLLKALENGPRMIDSFTMDDDGVDKYRLNSEALEADGILMRCGLTPTDMMHIKGDYDTFDGKASELAARFFMRGMPEFRNKTIEDFADAVYDKVCKKLYENIVRILLADRYPRHFGNGVDEQTARFIAESWDNREDGSILNISLNTPAALVGVGAPTHIFLHTVAEALGTKCIIPEHAEVANAVGAATADVAVTVRVEIYPIPAMGGNSGYTVHWPSGMASAPNIDEARKIALNAASEEAVKEARQRGALGELIVDAHLDTGEGAGVGEGSQMARGMAAIAYATGRITH